MFERAPFRQCPKCKEANTLGILSAGGSQIVRRCKLCRYRAVEYLPELDKKVIYLDQLAISEIFKIKSKTRRAGANNEDFWREVEREVDRTYLLQQAIFPASNIHRDETLVSPFASELMLAHDMLSGDISFTSVDEIAMNQVEAFAEAFFENKEPPIICFTIDDILDGERNEWIADLHIDANLNYSAFASHIRANRDAAASEFAPLLDRWAAEKPSFDTVLNRELKSYGSANRQALIHAVKRVEAAFESTDALDFFGKLSHPVMDQFNHLKAIFEERGLNAGEACKKVLHFWDWPGTEKLPIHQISAHLFAALARKISSGQKRRPSKGMFNDINAISAYGPYVDAMFLDNECAQFLLERPLSTALPLNAKIFSTNSGDDFLRYLRNLQHDASPLVSMKAAEIYGIAG